MCIKEHVEEIYQASRLNKNLETKTNNTYVDSKVMDDWQSPLLVPTAYDLIRLKRSKEVPHIKEHCRK
ncbi:MAG: hypothetical protein ACKPKO_06265 [Candidatus Fonsibacter sp.]